MIGQLNLQNSILPLSHNEGQCVTLATKKLSQNECYL